MPVKHEADTPMILYVFRHHADRRQALEQRAIREQTTESEIMRRAIDSYLEVYSCAGRPSATTPGCSDGD